MGGHFGTYSIVYWNRLHYCWIDLRNHLPCRNVRCVQRICIICSWYNRVNSWCICLVTFIFSSQESWSSSVFISLVLYKIIIIIYQLNQIYTISTIAVSILALCY